MPEAIIAATATAVPDHAVTREVVKTYFGQVFPLEGARLDAMMAVVDNSAIRQRFCILPVEELIRPRSLETISQQYQEHAIRLGRRVAAECLERAGVGPEEIDLIITVSCTGVMIPSLDAHLVNAMGFRSNVRRLPITELGCAAGPRRSPAGAISCWRFRQEGSSSWPSSWRASRFSAAASLRPT